MCWTCLLTIGIRKTMGSCSARPEEAGFCCGSFWRGLGDQLLLRSSISPSNNYVWRNCISNLQTNIIGLNGPLVGAPELPIGQCCVKARLESTHGAAPEPQNHHKTTQHSTNVFGFLACLFLSGGEGLPPTTHHPPLAPIATRWALGPSIGVRGLF